MSSSADLYIPKFNRAYMWGIRRQLEDALKDPSEPRRTLEWMFERYHDAQTEVDRIKTDITRLERELHAAGKEVDMAMDIYLEFAKKVLKPEKPDAASS